MVRYVGQPKIPHDFPRISVEMNIDASEKSTLEYFIEVLKVSLTVRLIKDIEAAIRQLNDC